MLAHLSALQPFAHAGFPLQPSLDPLPPYILAEAQLRSQRYQCLLCQGSPWRGASGHEYLQANFHCVASSPRAWVSQEIQEYLIEDSDDEVHTSES